MELSQSEKLKKAWITRRLNGNASPWNKGKKLPSLSDEHKKKLSLAHTGFVRSEEHNRKLMESRIRNGTVITPVKKGEHLSDEHKLAISLASIGKEATRKGSEHHRWKGGITGFRFTVRNCKPYKRWREAIFKRDEYRCVECHKLGCYIEADHIKPFTIILEENNITTLEQAIDCQELWSLENGRTLCKTCHKEIGWRSFKERNPRKKSLS